MLVLGCSERGLRLGWWVSGRGLLGPGFCSVLLGVDWRRVGDGGTYEAEHFVGLDRIGVGIERVGLNWGCGMK